MDTPSPDQLRLLYAIDRFTGENALKRGPSEKTRWMKELHLAVVVYHAIQNGLFADYDWAPSLVEFHGVKMYGKVSQEANADLRWLQSAKLVDKLHLSTCLYETIRAYRVTERAAPALGALESESKAALDRLLCCESCGALREVFAFVEKKTTGSLGVRNSTVHFCPRCCIVERTREGTRVREDRPGTRTVVDFFDLADIVYRTRAASLGGWL